MNQPEPSLDTVFDLLANRRRRYVLYCLADGDEETVLKVEEIAAQIASWEREWNATASEDAAARRTVRIDLHHNHLPRLDDAGLIEYDARTETIRSWVTPTLEQWVRDGDPELSRLRALFGGGDAARGGSN